MISSRPVFGLLLLSAAINASPAAAEPVGEFCVRQERAAAADVFLAFESETRAEIRHERFNDVPTGQTRCAPFHKRDARVTLSTPAIWRTLGVCTTQLSGRQGRLDASVSGSGFKVQAICP